METEKSKSQPVAVKKGTFTPKAIINQKFGGNASYKVEEVYEHNEKECPGLAIPQNKHCLYRCCLELPDFSVVSDICRKKKDAEQSAAQKALGKLRICPTPTENNPTVQEAWDELVARLSYFFSNEFLSSLHPLSGHLRAALRRKGPLNGFVPVSVMTVSDSKLSNLCKFINPELDTNQHLAMSLISKATASLHGSVCTSEDHLSVQRRDPYPPEVVQDLDNQQCILPESIWIKAIRIPSSVEKNVVPLGLEVPINGYYLDVIAQELGVRDASKVLISRIIGKASSSEMRFYFCAPNSYLLDVSSDVHAKEAGLPRSFNSRASYFSGQVIFGDAIWASVGYTWKSTDLFHEAVPLSMYYRLLISKTPGGIYKLGREAILAAELPVAFTTRANWKPPLPKEILFTFCRQHQLSEPVVDSMELSNEEGRNGGTFKCVVKILSKCHDLIMECAPKQSYKKQADAIQNVALKVLSWLNTYLKEVDFNLEHLISYADKNDIKLCPEYLSKEIRVCPFVSKVWQFVGTEEGRSLDSNAMDHLNMLEDNVIKGPNSGFTPPCGSLACISYSVSLVTEGDCINELLESSENFEFEIGTGAVIPHLETVVTHISTGQSTCFDIELPAQELILAASSDPERTLSFLSSAGGCCLRFNVTLLRMTEPLEERMEQALFSPPLAKQRVEYAVRHIRESSATSLVDFGCGSGSLLDSLLDYTTSLEKIVGVDLSVKSLARAAKMLHSKLSTNADAIALSNGIKSVLLYDGSITDFDSRLFGFDIGTCLEVIEHMEEDQAHLFGDIVLSSFCPRILIVSTPNYEYNIILQKAALQKQEDDSPDEKNQPKFRNHDHKFEWTREQFNRWASELAQRHNYGVKFSGVGGVDGVEPGFASQIALFRRRDDELPKNVGLVHLYNTVWEWSRQL